MTKTATHRDGRRKRRPPIPKALQEWIRDNPRAWSGWPTIDPCDHRVAQASLARLAAAGCPGGLLRSLPAVNRVVADIRLERRARLARQLLRVGCD